MKLVFVHDGPVTYDNEGNYYEFTYHGLLERYQYLADEVAFLIRTKPMSENRKYTLIPKEVEIISVPDFKNPKNIKNRPIADSIIKKAIQEANYVVFRMQSSIAQIGIKYAKKYHKPYIIESVACPWDSYWNHSLLGKMVAPFAYYETKKAIYHAPYVYYVTTEFLQKRYPTKGITVSCSNVVLKPVPKSVLERRISKIKNMKNEGKPLVLGTAAAIDVRYKGQEYIMYAIAHLKTQGIKFQYKLAGGLTGASENTFLLDLARKLDIEDLIIFEGALSSEQMDTYYDSLDIYIQPSKQEGLPRSVIEAMSRGCLCLGTDIAGIPELLQKECLFKKGSSTEVENAILRLLKLDLVSIATENYNKACEYEINKLAKKRNELYDKFISENA